MTESAKRPAGRVVFVGAGPGQADLITLRGADRLRQAEVVLFDSLADPALRRFAPRARWIDVGKRGFAGVAHGIANSAPATTATQGAQAAPHVDASSGQSAINAMLVKHALDGRLVVRLKGGDPSVFGRLEEELEALARHGIDCEVVPGVTAASAAAASTQRPLTRRGHGRSVTLATAMTREGGIAAGRHADTEVFYMAGRQLAALSRRLIAAGWPADTPALVVSRAGWPDEIASDHGVATLAEATPLHAGRPTIVCVGAGAVPVDACGHRQVSGSRVIAPAEVATL